MAELLCTWDPSDKQNYDVDHDYRSASLDVAVFEYFLDQPDTNKQDCYEVYDDTIYGFESPPLGHQILCRNLANLLQRQLPEGPYQLLHYVYVKAAHNQSSTMPQMVLTSTPSDYLPTHDTKKRHRVRHPRLVVEIWDPYGMGWRHRIKFQRYQKSPTLEGYLLLYPNLAIVRYHPCTHGLQEDDCAFYSSGKPLTFQVGDLQFQLDVDEIYRGLPRDGKYAIGRASEEEIRNVLLNWQNPTQEI